VGVDWLFQTSTAAADTADVDDVLILQKEAVSRKNHNT